MGGRATAVVLRRTHEPPDVPPVRRGLPRRGNIPLYEPVHMDYRAGPDSTCTPWQATERDDRQRPLQRHTAPLLNARLMLVPSLLRASSIDVNARPTPLDPPGKPAAPPNPVAPCCGRRGLRHDRIPRERSSREPRAGERYGDVGDVRIRLCDAMPDERNRMKGASRQNGAGLLQPRRAWRHRRQRQPEIARGGRRVSFTRNAASRLPADVSNWLRGGEGGS